jgi:hypothetical protein
MNRESKSHVCRKRSERNAAVAGDPADGFGFFRGTGMSFR